MKVGILPVAMLIWRYLGRFDFGGGLGGSWVGCSSRPDENCGALAGKTGGEGIIPYECLISILFLVYKCGQSLFWGWVEMSRNELKIGIGWYSYGPWVDTLGMFFRWWNIEE